MIVSKNQYWENETKNKEDKYIVQYATVVELTIQGEPILKFQGDLMPSKKIYKSLKSYVPDIGERVVIINNIITGGLKP